MVKDAIKTLGERTGSSLHNIKKYIEAVYKVTCSLKFMSAVDIASITVLLQALLLCPAVPTCRSTCATEPPESASSCARPLVTASWCRRGAAGPRAPLRCRRGSSDSGPRPLAGPPPRRLRPGPSQHPRPPPKRRPPGLRPRHVKQVAPRCPPLAPGCPPGRRRLPRQCPRSPPPPLGASGRAGSER